MNLLYPEMDCPSGPSIMGSENAKFSEPQQPRRNGQSDSDTTSEPHTPGEGLNASIMSSRKSRDGLSRDERMKLVRERQMEEHKRRLDELRQAQNQAMKAKHQQEEERRRRLEEIKSRDEQKRAAVDARRKRMDDDERERCEAIIRKHQEIFDRIDTKKRQHESRKMAYGLSTYQLSDLQDPVYAGGSQTSRRAVSASALSRQRGNQTSRSHHSHHQATPGSTAQSARVRPSPSTPSRNGGSGHFDSISGGSKTASSDNSPIHSGRHPSHIRVAKSHPPPVSRNRVPDTTRTAAATTTRSKPGSRPQTGQTDTQSPGTARAKRPTSLMTRSIGPETGVGRQGKSAATTPDAAAFRTMARRSQSVGNVSTRNRTKRGGDTLTVPKPTGSLATSPRKTEEVRFEEFPERQDSPDPNMTRADRKVMTEAEAKAALAEKRRQARQKVEFERTRLDDLTRDGPAESGEPLADRQPPSTLGVELPFREMTPRRASEIEFLELEKSFTEESRPADSVVFFKEFPSIATAPQNKSNPDSFSPLPEEETVGSGVLTNGGSHSPELTKEPGETAVRDSDVISEREPSVQDVVVEREATPKEDLPAVSVITEEPVVPEQKESVPEPEATVKADIIPAVPAAPSPLDAARLEAERRRLETEQRDEEERNARRQRLEAIKRLTKGVPAASGTVLTGSTERLASPVTETARPMDALENARKLLQRRGLGNEPSSLVSSPSTGSFQAASLTDQSLEAESKLNGGSDLAEGKSGVLEDGRSAMGTPFSDVSSVDTVSLNGYIRSQDDDGQLNGGFGTTTAARNGSASGMSETSSVDFDPYSSKDDWQHSNGVDAEPSLWNGSSVPRTTLNPGNADLLLNFDGH